ncbi:MAG: hypothetical protein IJC62_04280, partial [Clostridia bacterium]|nr:hypothetical protein [Clostridia bacterium]
MNSSKKIDILFGTDKAEAFVDGMGIGHIFFKKNPYHNNAYYLTLELQQYDIEISKVIFDTLREKLHKRLVVMISSSDIEVISFLLQCGFTLKRKCYDVNASVETWNKAESNVSILKADLGSDAYKMCSLIMLERYISTHSNINPYTASAEDFFNVLPETVYYEMFDDEIVSLAFVDENEIAYVCGTDIRSFFAFAQNLVSLMFQINKNITLEADDCDEYAMIIKNM